MGDEIVIRPPTPADGPGAGLAHVLAWQVGYEGLLPAEFLATLDADERGVRWTTRFERDEASEPDEADGALLVAKVGDQVAGIGMYGPYRTGDRTPLDGADQLCELWMINVHPDHWGTGVAQALMAGLLDGLRASRHEPTAALWVLDGNARGRRFYEKGGWRHDGVQKPDRIGEADVVELRYVITL